MNINDVAVGSTNELSNIQNYPWIILLFSKRNEEYIYLCSGTLITSSHVLTGNFLRKKIVSQ